MKINYYDLKEKLEQDYEVKGSIISILNGNRQPNSTLRYKYEKEIGIPFDGWGKNLKKYLETCECCGAILKKKKKDKKI
ncbi:MAG: hypothetical protein GXO60_07180 [Epsilonproteobacteria bacterium]|nr:hypothetical protein [Campylobacterota bacterium]